MKLLLSVLAASFVAFSGANARTRLPEYNIDAHCKDIATATSMLSRGMLDKCVINELKARERLGAVWVALPDVRRDRCVAAVRRISHSYLLLEACMGGRTGR